MEETTHPGVSFNDRLCKLRSGQLSQLPPPWLCLGRFESYPKGPSSPYVRFLVPNMDAKSYDGLTYRLLGLGQASGLKGVRSDFRVVFQVACLFN